MQNLQRTFHNGGASDAQIESAKSEVLKTVAYTLLRQVYGVTEPQTLDVQRGIDFYDEVRRFEVSLIRQALFYTHGKQSAAASLLNLNATTLHYKIKFFGIEMPALPDDNILPSKHRLLSETEVICAVWASPGDGGRTMRRPTSQDYIGEDGAPSVETLKTEVLKSIARALESKADNPNGVLDFDEKHGVNFYEEVTKFEVELITQALCCTKGNQRAAARLLGLKTSTLSSKVKTYNIDLASDES